jgi:hypothetical protein
MHVSRTAACAALVASLLVATNSAEGKLQQYVCDNMCTECTIEIPTVSITDSNQFGTLALTVKNADGTVDSAYCVESKTKGQAFSTDDLASLYEKDLNVPKTNVFSFVRECVDEKEEKEAVTISMDLAKTDCSGTMESITLIVGECYTEPHIIKYGSLLVAATASTWVEGVKVTKNGDFGSVHIYLSGATSNFRRCISGTSTEVTVSTAACKPGAGNGSFKITKVGKVKIIRDLYEIIADNTATSLTECKVEVLAVAELTSTFINADGNRADPSTGTAAWVVYRRHARGGCLGKAGAKRLWTCPVTTVKVSSTSAAPKSKTEAETTPAPEDSTGSTSGSSSSSTVFLASGMIAAALCVFA